MEKYDDAYFKVREECFFKNNAKGAKDQHRCGLYPERRIFRFWLGGFGFSELYISPRTLDFFILTRRLLEKYDDAYFKVREECFFKNNAKGAKDRHRCGFYPERRIFRLWLGGFGFSERRVLKGTQGEGNSKQRRQRRKRPASFFRLFACLLSPHFRPLVQA